MPEDRTLTPQTPGELPSVDQDRITTIAQGTVDDVLESIDGLTVIELEQLAVVERQGKDRKTLLGAIARELERRDAGEDPEPTGYTPPDIRGDAARYLDMRADDIDPTTLDRPVLSRDGWVMPPAKPEA